MNKCLVCGKPAKKKYCSVECYYNRPSQLSKNEELDEQIVNYLDECKNQGKEKIKFVDLVNHVDWNKDDKYTLTLERIIEMGYKVKVNGINGLFNGKQEE